MAEYAVTFSGKDAPDPLYASMGYDVMSDWSDTHYIDADSEEEAILKAKQKVGMHVRNGSAYNTEVIPSRPKQ